MKKIISISVLAGVILFAASCTKDKASSSTTTTAICDTSSITYTKTIKPIFDVNCATSSCHSNAAKAGSLDLSTYAGSKTGVAGNVICRMDLSCGGSMPPTGKLNDTIIAKISTWKTRGFCQ